jgi:hypothetical protein
MNCDCLDDPHIYPDTCIDCRRDVCPFGGCADRCDNILKEEGKIVCWQCGEKRYEKSMILRNMNFEDFKNIIIDECIENNNITADNIRDLINELQNIIN